jgi:SAM-dependent methyltransferase
MRAVVLEDDGVILQMDRRGPIPRTGKVLVTVRQVSAKDLQNQRDMFTESAEFYDAIYSFKDYATEAAQIADRVRSLRTNARTVLDVACGTGEHCRLLAEVHGFDVDGLDLDPGLLRVARQKHPAGRFFEADMSDFALGQRYDAILCLFSSIGYLVTLERVTCAFVCFRQHLAPEGVVLVEPWFAPGSLDTERVFRLTGMHRGMRVTRIGRNRVEGRISRLHFEYEFDGPNGQQRVAEVHELGLFTNKEMEDAFGRAGLNATLDPTGLTGRGLWIATAA